MMTEAEWLALNAGLMLLFIEENNAPSPRKMRLLATAYAGFLETQPEYADSKPVAYLGEAVADGVHTLDELWDERIRGWGHSGDWAIANLVLAGERLGNKIRFHLSGYKYDLSNPATNEAVQPHFVILRALILCIFGNPFRQVALAPVWLTSDVVALARGIYDEKAFDRMPILADALQDAGCDSDDVLDHCRGDNTHVRGCWVVDLVLGKE